MQSLTRKNLGQLEAIESLAERLGPAFATLLAALVERYTLDREEEVMRLRLALPGVIGLKSDTYQPLLQAALRCVEREPGFASRLATRHNDEQTCSIPYGLWLQLVEYAAVDPFAVSHGVQQVVDAAKLHALEGYPDRPDDDPAYRDATYLADRQKAGDSLASALAALVAHKRSQRS